MQAAVWQKQGMRTQDETRECSNLRHSLQSQSLTATLRLSCFSFLHGFTGLDGHGRLMHFAHMQITGGVGLGFSI